MLKSQYEAAFLGFATGKRKDGLAWARVSFLVNSSYYEVYLPDDRYDALIPLLSDICIGSVVRVSLGFHYIPSMSRWSVSLLDIN